MFTIPLNAWHRIVNATNEPALLQAGTTAPIVINALQNIDAVFNNPFEFLERFSTDDDFYKERTEVEPDPVRVLRCGAPTSCPTQLIASCRSTTGARRAGAVWSRS